MGRRSNMVTKEKVVDKILDKFEKYGPWTYDGVKQVEKQYKKKGLMYGEVYWRLWAIVLSYHLHKFEPSQLRRFYRACLRGVRATIFPCEWTLLSNRQLEVIGKYVPKVVLNTELSLEDETGRGELKIVREKLFGRETEYATLHNKTSV
jgi:hypothetical protein